MSAEHTTIAVIAPAATLDFARGLVMALVQTPWNALPFTAPLSASGAEPATHYGMQSAATEQFAGLILAVQSDPTDATAAAVIAARGLEGVTAGQVKAIVDSLHIAAAHYTAADGLFDGLATSAGLARIVEVLE